MNGVTIAIPTYNRGPILVETIGRLLQLTPRAAEIVVVDQTQSNPAEVDARLEEWSRGGEIRWIRLPEPSIPHAMNEALRIANRRIVLFVDDDVVPSPTLAAEHERAYAEDTHAVVGQVLQPGERVEHFNDWTLHGGELRDLQFRFNHDTACDVRNVIACNLSVDREQALAIGGFDENYGGAAYRFETDFALRLIAAGGRIRFEPRASLHHLHLATGGLRSYGDHRSSSSPSHSAGDYYFALTHHPHFGRYALSRMRRNILTRWHLRHPWAIVPKLVGELRGLREASALHRRGPRLITDRE